MSRATFERWKKDGKVIAQGPFVVEVYNDGTKQKPRWVACLCPTRVRFQGRAFQTAKEAQDTVADNFVRQLSQWSE